jgi:hypothetical protein
MSDKPGRNGHNDTTMPRNISQPYLSKSKFLWGLQCRKLLWTAYNAKDQMPPTDAQTQAVFDQGHDVGRLAQKLFPDGIEVGRGVADLGEVLRLSLPVVKQRKPLFEAAFAHQGGYARVDILEPVADDAWDIIEVKSSTSVKDVYLSDLAFQAFVYAGAGLKIRRCFLLLIDGAYVRHGEVDPRRFFKREDVTAQVSAMTARIESDLDSMAATIRLQQRPEIQIGSHCDDPYGCPLHDQCWHFLPDDNVMTLYRGAKKGFKLLADGVTRIKDIPAGYPLTDNQEIQRRVAATGRPHLDKIAIKTFLRQLEHPVSYLDFETFATAIPLFDDTSPFEQVPFQFSLHVVESPQSRPERRMFLADGRSDPRPELLLRLKEWLPDSGSVVAYNAQFERSRLRECCRLQPRYQGWLAGVESRLVDLLQPFRTFACYGPGQNGSASMKAVLPALTGRGYEHLEIQEGGTASLEFLRVHFKEVSEAERQRVRRRLEEYCSQDTEGMIWMIAALRKLVEQDVPL